MKRFVSALFLLVAVTGVPVQTAAVPSASTAPPARAVASVAPPACKGCPPPEECEDCWQPAVGTRWQIQLQGVEAYCDATGGVNTDVSAVPYAGGIEVAPEVYAFDVYVDVGVCTDYDPGTLSRAAVEALHEKGLKVIAYISAGTWEQWRPDQEVFVRFDDRCDGCLLGNPLGRYPDERWLNIGNDQGQRRFLLERMGIRIEKAERAGFDGVYFDNQDEWQYASPFDITAHDQIMYLTRLLNFAHRHGLATGPNNDILQTELFEPYADFMVNEQCFQYTECRYVHAMVDAGKPVFEIEYRVKRIEGFCRKAERKDIETIRKANELYDLPWKPCR